MAGSGLLGLGFPRSLRLRRSIDFKRIQRRGHRLATRNLRVCVMPTALGGPRFGLTVSRKVGNAVVRNRVKRWLREAIRHERVSSATGSFDLVFIARPSAAQSSAADLRAEVAESLSRVGRRR